MNAFNPLNWHSKFKKHAIMTKMMKLNYRFLQFLNEDGIRIAKKYEQMPNISSQTKGIAV